MGSDLLYRLCGVVSLHQRDVGFVEPEGYQGGMNASQDADPPEGVFFLPEQFPESLVGRTAYELESKLCDSSLELSSPTGPKYSQCVSSVPSGLGSYRIR